MITLICSNCGHTLQVDDGFAGGVCRCSHCAAIQTVPTRTHVQAANTAAVSGRTLYQRKPRGTSDELDQLSDIVTSSGLTSAGIGSGMSSGLGTARPSSAKQNRPMLPILIGGGAALVVAGIALGVFLGRPGKPETATPPVDAEAGSATPAIAAAPTPPRAPRRSTPGFGSIDLAGPTVIYVLDRGDATVDFLPALQRAVAGSAESLGPGRRFQVLFWTSGGETPAYPASPRPASPDAVRQTMALVANQVSGSRATDPVPALERAMRELPSDIVFATGKGLQLDEALVPQVVAAAKLNSVKVHTVDLHQLDDPSEVLRSIAKGTGGTFLRLNPSSLEAIGN